MAYVIIAALIVAAGFVAAAIIVRKGLENVGANWGLGQQPDFVSLDKLMAEQFPEQYTTLPGDLLLEEDFTLLD